MNLKQRKEIRSYLKVISKQIPEEYPNKKILINIVHQNINNFLSEHPESTMDSIMEEFGSPSEIAASFIEDLPDMDIAVMLKKKQQLFGIMVIVCFLCCIIFIYLLQYVYKWYHNDALYFEETLYIIDGTEMPTEWEEKILNGENTDEPQE